ncbi:YciI family protein [Lentzea sp. NPDC005914]|uniref:YciI family protein n=1 Tax=Lentzea sp. NPDC005914 TaxID=3154572 RepID=UPI0033EF819F
MFIVLLKYSAPLEQIDYALPDHREWVEKQYERGLFLASGRQVPRVGGVIITRPMPRGKLEALLATDPWCEQKLVKYEICEFEATRTAPELMKLNEAVLQG